jgi:hypothetical protein
VQHDPLGSLAHIEYGDLVVGPVTVFRVVGEGRATSLPGYEGAVFDRVIVARADLLR